jgi:hypothetical protein
MSRLFGRWDRAGLMRLLDEGGLLAPLRAKGFGDFAVSIGGDGDSLTQITLRARKDGLSHLLLEACLRRIRAAVEGVPLDLLLVHWVREQDPTATFTATRPALLLQRHPGLGVLRRAFRVALRIGAELGVDGVANQPKFYHDAVIFYRSRLFLFVDGREQGRFEALQRDLAALPLPDATLAVASWSVRDRGDDIVRWEPGYQIFPLSERLTTHFNAAAYAAQVAAARESEHFRVDLASLAGAHAELGLTQ